MPKRYLVILLLIFLVLFNWRVQSVGGINKADSKVDFSNLTENFSPLSQLLNQKINQLLPETQAGLLAGILLGIKSDLPADFKTALATTSTIHIVVVSGQNLSLIVGFIMSLAPIIGRRKNILLAFVGIIFYSLLTGFQVPVIRAAIMSSVVLFSQLIGREREGWWILALTGAAMLLYNPSWIISISFQLSFAATLGALIISRSIIPILKFLPEIIREDVAVTLGAQLMVMPIIAANFHQISLIGVIANALVLGTVSPVMISGMVAIAAASIFLPLGQLFAFIPLALLTYFIYIIEFFNRLPMSSIIVFGWNSTITIGYYLVLLGLFLFLRANTSELAPGMKPREELSASADTSLALLRGSSFLKKSQENESEETTESKQSGGWYRMGF